MFPKFARIKTPSEINVEVSDQVPLQVMVVFVEDGNL